MTEQKLKIGLYADTGVAPNSYLQLKHHLSDSYTITKLKSSDIIAKTWPDDMRAIVMPGGADVPYHQKLQGQGAANIRTFVENGGIYIGVCAGSYFACREIHFTCNDGSVIQDNRNLAFFDGRCIGPTFGPYIEEGHLSARLVPIVINNKILKAYYNGGGYFEDAQDSDDVSVLGRYHENNQPMALHCKVGKGYAFLCAVHPEYDQARIKKILTSKVAGYQILEQIMQDGISPQINDWFLKHLGNFTKNNSNIEI